MSVEEAELFRADSWDVRCERCGWTYAETATFFDFGEEAILIAAWQAKREAISHQCPPKISIKSPNGDWEALEGFGLV